MSKLYILQNQDKLFLGKQKDWLDGRDRNSLYRTPHKDEAVNQRVEISAKDYTQRITLLTCATDERGLPVIDSDLMPPAQPGPSEADRTNQNESPKESPEAMNSDESLAESQA